MDDRVKLLWSYGFDLNGALRSRGVDVRRRRPYEGEKDEPV
jgi:hypothetical protein